LIPPLEGEHGREPGEGTSANARFHLGFKYCITRQVLVKMSNLIDPSDETEFSAATPNHLRRWYENYKSLKHGDPLVEKEPSPDQLAAMHTRVVSLGMEPYADFSLLTPYGRRMAKVLRHRSWVLQEDGTYRPMEVPGPDSFEIWDACFKVYEVILLMLRFPEDPGLQDIEKDNVLVVTPIAIEAYREAFASLARDHPECWHLCQRAEDRCRAEHFPRLARKLLANNGYTPTWSQVFVAAAEDDRYWDREVRRPALTFLARGKRALSEGPSPSVPQNAISKKAKKIERAAVAERPFQGGQGGRGEEKPLSKKEHPRKDRLGKFCTTREGKEICFTFAIGERGVCKEPCKNKRAHVCQHCLGPHSNKACTKKV
jgi:hypothetical protein